MAEPTTTPAETASVETPKEAPKGASPLEDYMKQTGLTAEQAIEALQTLAYAGTPEGQQEIVKRVAERHGDDIAKQRIARDPSVLKTLDSRQRRAIRRAVATKEEIEMGFEDPAEDAPNPAEEARVAAQAAGVQAAEAKSIAMTTAEAIRVGPLLVAHANKNPVIAEHMEEWQDEVMPLLAGNDPRFRGFSKASIERASEFVINRWRRNGEMAGLSQPAVASPTATGTVTGPKKEDIEQRMSKATTREQKLAEASKIWAELDGAQSQQR